MQYEKERKVNINGEVSSVELTEEFKLTKKSDISEVAKTVYAKYLTDVINEDKPTFTNNTMIISPVGSGKTTFIKEKAEELTKANANKLVFLLVSNIFLAQSLAPDDIELRKILANRCVAPNETVEVYGEGGVVIRVMTYAKFGREIASGHEYAKKAAAIFCDEIHSLVDYHSYNRSELLAHAISYLFAEHKSMSIFYFTATAEKLNKFNESDRVYRFITKNINTIDYTTYPGIIKLKEEKVSKA